LQKYEVLECGDVEKLIRKRESPLSSPVYFVHIEETYGVISRAHIATGHGGRDRMHKHLSPKYANIHIEFLEIFKSFCLSCQEKKSRKRIKGIVVKPILSDNFNSRMQIDLIDMQSSRNSRYNWILVAQCHLTKFVVLRPLTSKRAIEVAHQVLDIFLLLGAPAILQSDNGSEFTAKVIEELKSLWPTLAMVHGKPRHPQSQGSVERANGDVKNMLLAWMSDNSTQDWPVGLKFVQQNKNCSFHAGIKMSPYKAMFGVEPRIGLASTALPPEIIHQLQTEDDLRAACQGSGDTGESFHLGDTNVEDALVSGDGSYAEFAAEYDSNDAEGDAPHNTVHDAPCDALSLRDTSNEPLHESTNEVDNAAYLYSAESIDCKLSF